MIVRVYRRLQKLIPLSLTFYGVGSLETFLQQEGIEVFPFDRRNTLIDIAQHGNVVGVYCSEIDAFGMSALESQAANIPTIILDRGGARETILSNLSDELVGHLVDSEEMLFATICYFIEHKMFPENMSIVNFSHHRDYFTLQRLSDDLLILMSKNQGKMLHL